MGIIAFIGIIVIVYHLVKESCEVQLPAEYHNNWRAEHADANKVRTGQMSRKEFKRNIYNGKYK